VSDEKDLPPKMRPSAQAAPAKPKPRPQDPVCPSSKHLAQLAA